MSAEYGDVHRNLLQLLLDRGVFTEQDLLKKFAECIQEHKDDAKRAKLRYHSDDPERNLKALQSVVDQLDEQLKTLGMKVARMRSKASGVQETYFGIVDLNSSDTFSKLASPLGKAEQEFFRRVVADILASEDKEIDSASAKNIGRDLTTSKLNGAEAEACLERLERGFWLVKAVYDDEVRYKLGVRSEFQQRYAPTEAMEEQVSEI